MLEHIFAALGLADGLFVRRIIEVGRNFVEIILIPIDGDDDVIIEISKLEILEERNIIFEVAILGFTSIDIFGLRAEMELIFTEEAVILIEMIVFDDSDLIWFFVALIAAVHFGILRLME